jgi:hypothetical protein
MQEQDITARKIRALRQFKKINYMSRGLLRFRKCFDHFEYEFALISAKCLSVTSGAKSVSATAYALIQNANKRIREGAG